MDEPSSSVSPPRPPPPPAGGGGGGGGAPSPISLPAPTLLQPRWIWQRGLPSVGHRHDANWLVRMISRRAFDLFKLSGVYEGIVAAGGSAVHKTGRHKKHVLDFGESQAVVQHSASDRPAFTITVQDPLADADQEVISKEWSHSYIAMGLPMQHQWQQTLLCRAYQMDTAACFIRAAQDILQLSFTLKQVHCDDADLIPSFIQAIMRANVDETEARDDQAGLSLRSVPHGFVWTTTAHARTLGGCGNLVRRLFPGRAEFSALCPSFLAKHSFQAP